jgi:hypothetical protein
MKSRKPTVAFALTVTAGAVYLLDALYATIDLVPCTSTGPASPGPCNESAAVIGWVSGLGVALVLLGLLVVSVRAYPRLRLVWSVLVIAASAGGYVLLLVVVLLKSYSPAFTAVLGFGLLFLPALLLGALGGTVGLHSMLPEPTSPTRPNARG